MSTTRSTMWVAVLAAMVLTIAGPGGVRAAASDAKPQLDWVPDGKLEWHDGWMNGYARGLDLILNRTGSEADYVTIMGDIGLAFIVQGEENSINRLEGAVDVGWWPLEPLGMIRLDFLEKTVGREIQDIKLPSGTGREDPISTYKQWFAPAVISSIEDGKPSLLRVGTSWYVVTGYDDQESPLFGMCSNTEAGQEKVDRVEERMPPYAGFTLGERIQTIDRKAADLEALRFAVALHRDQVLGDEGQYAGTYPLRRAEEFGRYWRTGINSLASWIACLEDTEHLGQPRWHSNVVQHLYWNRTTAVHYLAAMKERHSPAVAAHLEIAIQKYQAVIDAVGEADTSDVLMEVAGRKKLIAIVEKIVDLETQAATELERAAEAIG